MCGKTIPFAEVKRDLLQDPATRKIYDELEPAYQVARLRIMRGLTQQQLAERVGTKQASIARLESGNHLPSLTFLRKVVAALDGQLRIEIMPHKGKDAREP